MLDRSGRARTQKHQTRVDWTLAEVKRGYAPAMPRRTSAVTVTQVEAAHILGCSVQKVRALTAAGDLTGGPRYQHRSLDRAQVEHLAVRRWKRRRAAVDDGMSYWVTTPQAAAILGVNRNRVGQLVERGFLPCMRTPSGRRLFRRGQVEVIANARRSRRLRRPDQMGSADPDQASPTANRWPTR